MQATAMLVLDGNTRWRGRLSSRIQCLKGNDLVSHICIIDQSNAVMRWFSSADSSAPKSGGPFCKPGPFGAAVWLFCRRDCIFARLK